MVRTARTQANVTAHKRRCFQNYHFLNKTEHDGWIDGWMGDS